MAYVVITRTTPEGRVAKFATFRSRAPAEAHRDEFGGFVAPRPAAHWSSWLIVGEVITIVPLPAEPPEPVRPMVLAMRALADRLGVDARAEIDSILGG